jgi:hypothetical protein
MRLIRSSNTEAHPLLRPLAAKEASK